jgi:hypothetical protein
MDIKVDLSTTFTPFSLSPFSFTSMEEQIGFRCSIVPDPHNTSRVFDSNV